MVQVVGEPATRASDAPFVDTYVNDTVLSAIEILTSEGYSEFLRWTATCKDVTATDADHNTLLHWAAALGDITAMSHLLQLGLNVNTVNVIGATPLHCAAASSPNPGASLYFLIQSGANIEAVNHGGDTMISLLGKRHLFFLGDLMLRTHSAMTSVPKLFAPAGVTEGTPVAVAVGSQLGSCEALAKDASDILQPVLSTGTLPQSVHGSSSCRLLPKTTMPEARTESNSDDMHDGNGGGSTGSPWVQMLGDQNSGCYSSPLEYRKDFSSSCFSGSSAVPKYCCDAYWWLADRERRLVFLEEEIARLHIECEWRDWLWGIMGSLFACGVISSSSVGNTEDMVAGVLGEKHTNGTDRMLLVRWKVPDGDGDGDNVDWVPLSAVYHCVAVREYLNRMDKTSSVVYDADDDELCISDGDARALDTLEREELERELRMLPRRHLSPVSTISHGLPGLESARFSSPFLLLKGRSQKHFEHVILAEERLHLYNGDCGDIDVDDGAEDNLVAHDCAHMSGLRESNGEMCAVPPGDWDCQSSLFYDHAMQHGSIGDGRGESMASFTGASRFEPRCPLNPLIDVLQTTSRTMHQKKNSGDQDCASRHVRISNDDECRRASGFSSQDTLPGGRADSKACLPPMQLCSIGVTRGDSGVSPSGTPSVFACSSTCCPEQLHTHRGSFRSAARATASPSRMDDVSSAMADVTVSSHLNNDSTATIETDASCSKTRYETPTRLSANGVRKLVKDESLVANNGSSAAPHRPLVINRREGKQSMVQNQLSETQKVRYEKCLYSNALRALMERQRRACEGFSVCRERA